MNPPPPSFGYADVGVLKKYTCDAVIVGAGAGGGAVAKVLSEFGLNVLVIESGPKQSRFRPNYAHTAKYHMQEGGSMVAKGSTFMPIAAGKGIGGSTLINSALCFKAPDTVLNNWSGILKDERWSANELMPLFEQTARYIGVSKTPKSIAGKNNDLIVKGIKSLGYNGGLAPRSTPRCVGCGICYYGCPSGGKNSVNFNFLSDAHKAGCQIQAEVHITEIHTKTKNNKTYASGVAGKSIDPETGKATGRIEVEAQWVILSAGAIGTPRLLHQAGLSNLLGPAVGSGLHVHPGSTLIGISDEKIEMWKGATQGAYYHPPNMPGVLPHTFSAPPEACLVAGGFLGDSFQEGLSLLPHLCGMLAMVSDKGTGSVGVRSDGRAKISYHFAQDDVDRIKQGLVSVSKVLLSGGAKDLRAPIHGVGIINDPEELEKALKKTSIQDFTLYAAHPMASCRMGNTIEHSVTSSTGETHGCNNLIIADASVFPTSLGVNPQLSTMVSATNIALMLINRIEATQ
ncbi:MAG: hypothetical protein CMK59_03150 [Proteobacteria bacterium]|nr:hypothetical protein [Pseudomonadota bacterium]